MAGPVWARVTIDADLDGDNLVPQTRAAAEKAGLAGGETFSKSFDKSAGAGIKKSLAGFSKSFKTWDKNLADNNKTMGNLSRRTRAFLKTVGNTEPMLRARIALGELTKDFDKATAAGERHGSMWKNLSANTRQWTLIIGAVIGSLGELAGLGSAAGSGIFVLAGAFSALVTGAGLAVVAFAKFMGDIENVPKGLRDSRRAFDEFKKTFGEVMDEMTTHAFFDTIEAWQKLGKVVKALQPGFNQIGDVVNGLVKDFADAFDTDLIQDLNRFLQQSGRVLDRVLRAVGRLGVALLAAFNSPAFTRALDDLLNGLDWLVDKFSAFLTGPGFDEWMRHGEQVFGALGDLLKTTGTLLNDMVTDETIKQLTDFIGHIDGFLSGGGKGILDFAQKLDIFGIIAKALDDFGKALEPLAGPMADFGEAINIVLSTAIDTLAPIINDIATALGPFVQGLADFMKENPQLIADVLLAIGAGFLAIKAVGIATSITAPLRGFVGVASKKNTGLLTKFAVGIAGITLALQGLQDQNKEGGGLEGGGGGVLETIAGGALIGASFGPIGAAIGALGGAIASMIQDMFLSPDIEGAWKTGWDQLFDPTDFSGGGIGPIKEWWANEIQPFFDGLPATVNNAGTAVADSVHAMVAGIKQAFTEFAPDFAAGWFGFWEGLPAAVNQFGSDITTNVRNAWLPVKDFFITAWNDLTTGWNNFWGGLPDRVNQWGSDIETMVRGWWNTIKDLFRQPVADIKQGWETFWDGLPAPVHDAVREISNFLRDLYTPIQNAIGWFQSLFGAASSAQTKSSGAAGGGGGMVRAASGMLLTGPRRILAGEAGPEAVVPLKRSLSRVDPSVRWLSAIAQGKTPAMASGGVVSGGRSLTVAPGAIVINGVRDPNAAAVGVVNRLAERIAS